MASHILVLNGPNLNLLGTREPAVYGSQTLADIESELAPVAQRKNAQVVFFQTNHEGVLIDRIHLARTDGTDFIIINAGAFGHTCIALRDALAAADVVLACAGDVPLYRSSSVKPAPTRKLSSSVLSRGPCGGNHHRARGRGIPVRVGFRAE